MDEYTKITPAMMFVMIDDFAQGMMQFCRDKGLIDEPIMLKAFQEMMDTFQRLNIESRVSIVTMLLGACAMYELTMDQQLEELIKNLPCRKDLN